MPTTAPNTPAPAVSGERSPLKQSLGPSLRSTAAALMAAAGLGLEAATERPMVNNLGTEQGPPLLSLCTGQPTIGAVRMQGAVLSMSAVATTIVVPEPFYLTRVRVQAGSNIPATTYWNKDVYFLALSIWQGEVGGNGDDALQSWSHNPNANSPEGMLPGFQYYSMKNLHSEQHGTNSRGNSVIYCEFGPPDADPEPKLIDAGVHKLTFWTHSAIGIQQRGGAHEPVRTVVKNNRMGPDEYYHIKDGGSPYGFTANPLLFSLDGIPANPPVEYKAPELSISKDGGGVTITVRFNSPDVELLRAAQAAGPYEPVSYPHYDLSPAGQTPTGIPVEKTRVYDVGVNAPASFFRARNVEE